jgi:hypothetical protein
VLELIATIHFMKAISDVSGTGTAQMEAMVPRRRFIMKLDAMWSKHTMPQKEMFPTLLQQEMSNANSMAATLFSIPIFLPISISKS